MRTALRPPLDAPGQLRVALLVPAGSVAAWVARAIESIRSLPWVDVDCLLMVADADRARTSGGLAARYLSWDRHRYRRAHSALAAGVVDTDSMDTHTLAVGGKSDVLRAQLAARDLDVIIDLGTSAELGELADCARQGVWWHGTGEPAQRLGTAGLWSPVFAGQSITIIGLYALSSTHSGNRCLTEGVASTHMLSVELNGSQGMWRFADMAATCLYRLASEQLGREPTSTAAAQGLTPESEPGLVATALFLPRLAWRRLKASVHRRRDAAHWILACRPEGPQLDPVVPRFRAPHVLEAPAGHFWADPWLIEHAGQTWLFVEDFSYDRDVGSIACMALDADGRPGDARIVLSLDSHLSYPQVFEHGGDLFMLPENGQEKALTLYRANKFPWSWRPVATLLEGYNFTDATLWHQEGSWYLFTSLSMNGASDHDELYLFHAADLHGPWTPHPGNPVVSDVRRARPAGPLFRRNGKLWRPAQNCAATYGGAVVFNEVLVLNADDYREQPRGCLDGHWKRGLNGCHTYASTASLEVVDGKFWARKTAVGAPTGESGS